MRRAVRALLLAGTLVACGQGAEGPGRVPDAASTRLPLTDAETGGPSLFVPVRVKIVAGSPCWMISSAPSRRSRRCSAIRL